MALTVTAEVYTASCSPACPHNTYTALMIYIHAYTHTHIGDSALAKLLQQGKHWIGGQWESCGHAQCKGESLSNQIVVCQSSVASLWACCVSRCSDCRWKLVNSAKNTIILTSRCRFPACICFQVALATTNDGDDENLFLSYVETRTATCPVSHWSIFVHWFLTILSLSFI